MIFVHLHKAPVIVLHKLHHLFTVLRSSKGFYEQQSHRCQDVMLQRSLRIISQEHCQYANEISSQLLSMGNNPEDVLTIEVCTVQDAIEAIYTGAKPEDKLIILCTGKEKETITAYRSILNEFEVPADLRRMLRYQLNGVLCSFLQLKLLKS